MEEEGWDKDMHGPGILYNMGRQVYSIEEVNAYMAEQERKKRQTWGLGPPIRVPVRRSKKPTRSKKPNFKKKLGLKGRAQRVPVSKRRLDGRGFDKKKLKCNTPVKSYKPQKKKMVRACSRGKEKLIHFGATGYGNNYSAGARRAFRARHKCSKAKDKLTARYWACHNLWAGPGGDTRKPPNRKKRQVKGGKRKKSPVSLKISQLVKEGYPHKQAVAIALSMQESGRITKSGGYRRRKRSSRRRRKRSPRRRRKRSPRRRGKRSPSRRRKRSSRRRN